MIKMTVTIQRRIVQGQLNVAADIDMADAMYRPRCGEYQCRDRSCMLAAARDVWADARSLSSWRDSCTRLRSYLEPRS
jgi:hypothetical protein